MSLQYGPKIANTSDRTALTDCGGCRGLGAHARWCPEVVGTRAYFLGTYADQAESLADAIGSLNVAAANHIYIAAQDLRNRATREAVAWKAAR